MNSWSYGVSKGSIVKVGIPTDFLIYDPTITASTCLKIAGFSDEISCTVVPSTTSNGLHMVTVTNGFGSKAFAGGIFSFNISEIRNPHNSIQTGSFSVNVYDANGNLQYTYGGNPVYMMFRPQPFLYAMVSSSSPATGVSSLYTFTLTLSVDTDVNSVI